mgnify:CR=1 FL=1
MSKNVCVQLEAALRSVKPLEDSVLRAEAKAAQAESALEASYKEASSKQREWESLVKRLQRKASAASTRANELAREVRSMSTRNAELAGKLKSAETGAEAARISWSQQRDDLAASVLRAREEAVAAKEDAQRREGELRAAHARYLSEQQEQANAATKALRDSLQQDFAEERERWVGCGCRCCCTSELT